MQDMYKPVMIHGPWVFLFTCIMIFTTILTRTTSTGWSTINTCSFSGKWMVTTIHAELFTSPSTMCHRTRHGIPGPTLGGNGPARPDSRSALRWSSQSLACCCRQWVEGTGRCPSWWLKCHAYRSTFAASPWSIQTRISMIVIDTMRSTPVNIITQFSLLLLPQRSMILYIYITPTNAYIVNACFSFWCPESRTLYRSGVATSDKSGWGFDARVQSCVHVNADNGAPYSQQHGMPGIPLAYMYI